MQVVESFEWGRLVACLLNKLLSIAHRPVGRYLPDLDGIVVIVRIHPTSLNQGCKGRLHVAGLINAARLQSGGLPIPIPGEPESGERDSQPRLVDARVLPGFSVVGGNLDALDATATRPGESGDLVHAGTRELLSAGRERDHRFGFHLERELPRRS